VLTEACRQAADWQRSRFHTDTLAVSVNVSPLQIDRGALTDDVQKAVRGTGLLPGSLRLEITESVLVKWAEGLTETLCNLRAQGIQLVLDDFGTGYSALGYLNRFPIDALKIDRSFVAGIGSDREHSAIVQAVIDMAGALGISVIAEGVETQLHADTLYEMGCRYAQGFHFARPAPSEEIGVLLTDG
jgi:EAL domain-containing protein (putative c-di-GMP-specific phosphodiesterase class I)